MLRIKKKIWSSVNPICKTISQACKMMFKQIVSLLFQCCSNAFWKHWNNTLTICLKVILWTRALSVGGFRCDTDAAYNSHCVLMIFSAAYPARQFFVLFQQDIHDVICTTLFCLHDLFTFQKFCASVGIHF